MLPSLQLFLKDNISIALEKLQKQHSIFLIGSGDVDLDWQIELSLIQESKKGKPQIIKALSLDWLNELPTANKVYIVRDFPTIIQKMDAEEINRFVKSISDLNQWPCYVIFHMGVHAESAMQVMQTLSGANDKLNLGLHINPSIPRELYFPILAESLGNQQVVVHDEVKQRMELDLKEIRFSYTHIRIFIQLVLQLLQPKQKSSGPLTLTNADYEEMGTLRYFIEFNGKAFLNQAESLIDIQSIEWIFRSLIFVQQNKPQILQLSIDQIQSRCGIEKNKIAPVLDLAAGGGFDLLRFEGGNYSILNKEYVEEWSDLKKWVENESESVKLFEKYRSLAYQHADGSGQLLTGVQLEETNRWQQMNSLQPDWAILYYPDLELVKGFIAASELAYKEYLDGQEKARSRRLKFAYQLAGSAVVVGVLVLMLSMWAWGQKKLAEAQTAKVELEKKRTDSAYRSAESNRKRAVYLQGEAIKSEKQATLSAEAAKKAESIALMKQQEAIQAQQEALRSLTAEKEAKLKELAAKEDAIKERTRAQLNEEKAKKEEANAIANEKRAEKLRIQQLSRANALAVYEDYDNDQFEIGREKATNAYEEFIKNGGNPYDRDILTALIEGAMWHKPSEFKKELKLQPLRMVVDQKTDKLAIYGLDQKVKIFNTRSKSEINKDFYVNKLYGLGFLPDQTIAGASASSIYLPLNNPKSAMIPMELKGKEILQLFIIPSATQQIWVSTPKELVVYDYQVNKSLSFKGSINIGRVSSLRKMDTYWLCVSGNKLIRFNYDSKEIKEIKQFRSNITAISGTLSNKWVAVGDENGNIFIVDPITGEIKAERSKLHLSRISGLETVRFKNLDILVSSGFDQFLHIFYLDTDQLQNASFPSPISLREHKRWITGLTIDPSTLQAITCSVDETLRFWPLDPKTYLFKGVVSINSSKKMNHP